MKGCLATIGGIVIVLVALAMCVGSNMASSFNQASHERTGVSASSSDTACKTADERERQAAAYINNDEYQKTYDTAISGLHYVELCGNDDDKRMRSAESATYLVWALLARRKQHWRRFNGYALLAQVHAAMLRKPVALRKAA